MAYALRALGKDVDDRQPAIAAPGPLLAVPRRRTPSRSPTAGDRRLRRRHHHGVRRPRPPGRHGPRSIFVINIDHHPGNTGFGDINWFDPSAAACGEMVFDLIRALGVAVVARDRHARLSRDPDRHRFVPLLGHLAAHLRRSARQALEAGVDPVLVARNVYDSNNMGRLKLFGAVLSAMQIDPIGTYRHRLRRSRDGARGRRHLRRHRGAGEPAADRQGNRGGGVLQAGAGRRVPRQPALEGRISTSAPSRTNSAAAATRTPPGARSDGTIDELRQQLVEKVERAIGQETRPA